jgi:hypothetical protein
LENRVTEDEKIKYDEAEAMLLGLTLPEKVENSEPQPELKDFPPDPKDWTEEDKKRVADIISGLLEREPEPEKIDLREHFEKGEKFTDPEGIQTVVRSVGAQAMTIAVWGKKGRFVDGYEIRLRGFSFITKRSRGNKTTIQLQGRVPEIPEALDGETKSK